MRERYERMSERTSEWPSPSVPILGCSEPLWGRGVEEVGLEVNLLSHYVRKRASSIQEMAIN